MQYALLLIATISCSKRAFPDLDDFANLLIRCWMRSAALGVDFSHAVSHNTPPNKKEESQESLEGLERPFSRGSRLTPNSRNLLASSYIPMVVIYAKYLKNSPAVGKYVAQVSN